MDLSLNREKLESCAECTCFNLRKASRAITQLFDRAMKNSGLRGTQFSILAVLSALGTGTITRLSEILVMDRTTLTRNLKPMENAGLIKIAQGSNLRSKAVSLTKKGHQTLAGTFPHWKRTQDLIIEKLGRERFNYLIRDLSEISEMFSARGSAG
ncbi:MAG: MarR family winged helix-turn-helix transcriptional regulator [Thermodesulfovibrionales bacterium]